MIDKKMFKLGLPVLVFFCISSCSCDSTGRACYHAKVCIHNGDEKCGIDSKGVVRKFIDSCDIKEYNCLRGTDFEKTVFEKCAHLPPINNDKQEKSKKKLNEDVDDENKSISETKNITDDKIKTDEENEEDDIKNTSAHTTEVEEEEEMPRKEVLQGENDVSVEITVMEGNDESETNTITEAKDIDGENTDYDLKGNSNDEDDGSQLENENDDHDEVNEDTIKD